LYENIASGNPVSYSCANEGRVVGGLVRLQRLHGLREHDAKDEGADEHEDEAGTKNQFLNPGDNKKYGFIPKIDQRISLL
jgi:hypothetical protein